MIRSHPTHRCHVPSTIFPGPPLPGALLTKAVDRNTIYHCSLLHNGQKCLRFASLTKPELHLFPAPVDQSPVPLAGGKDPPPELLGNLFIAPIVEEPAQ